MSEADDDDVDDDAVDDDEVDDDEVDDADDDVDYDLLKKYLASADGDLMGARIVMFPPRWFRQYW